MKPDETVIPSIEKYINYSSFFVCFVVVVSYFIVLYNFLCVHSYFENNVYILSLLKLYSYSELLEERSNSVIERVHPIVQSMLHQWILLQFGMRMR